mmetsp:Transcript_15481/g.42930  ORF Transcript_15481/g.42930 Transcript_15481/m.42930 type:complete len:102 (+) Transcript_15481:995-1300(+)
MPLDLVQGSNTFGICSTLRPNAPNCILKESINFMDGKLQTPLLTITNRRNESTGKWQRPRNNACVDDSGFEFEGWVEPKTEESEVRNNSFVVGCFQSRRFQ